MDKKFQTFLENEIDKVITEKMSGYKHADKKMNEEEGEDISPVDSFISSIQSSCSEDLAGITSLQDKVLAIAKVGKVLFNMNPQILADIFTRLAEAEQGEDEAEVDVEDEMDEGKKKVNESTDDFNLLKNSLISQIQIYDYPLNIAYQEDDYMGEVETVASPENFAQTVVDKIVDIYGSWEDFTEEFCDWMNCSENPSEIASEMHYESYNGMAIGISESYAYVIDPEVEEY